MDNSIHRFSSTIAGCNPESLCDGVSASSPSVRPSVNKLFGFSAITNPTNPDGFQPNMANISDRFKSGRNPLSMSRSSGH